MVAMMGTVEKEEPIPMVMSRPTSSIRKAAVLVARHHAGDGLHQALHPVGLLHHGGRSRRRRS